MTELVGFQTMVILDTYGITHGLRTPNESFFSKFPNILADWANWSKIFRPAFSNILEEPLIGQKQTIAQKKL